MKLLVTGVSHKTAPVEVRERLAFAEATLPSALRALLAHTGVSEAMVLSTCNRVEIAVCADDAIDPVATVYGFLQESRGVTPEELGPSLYHLEGREAIHHLFRVAASLDSMVVGEPQILGQLKAAYAHAKSNDCLNGLLENVVARAFNARTLVTCRRRGERGTGAQVGCQGLAASRISPQGSRRSPR